MFRKLLITGIGVSALFSGLAQAENYYGGNVSFLTYSEDGIDDDASLNAVFGRLGTHFNDYFSGEVRLGVGLGDDTLTVDGLDRTVEIDSMFGGYVRGGIPVSESFFPYAIVGYTRGELTASISGFGSASDSETDISYGVGADVNVSQRIIINLEYMNYVDKGGAQVDGFSIGIAGTF